MLSIHAPREGSDPPQICTARSSADFNPRSTYGERGLKLHTVQPAADTLHRSPRGKRGLKLREPCTRVPQQRIAPRMWSVD